MNRIASLFALALVLIAIPCFAQMGTPPVQVSLYPSVTEIVPGASFDIAVRFQVPDGWHLYWKNPGDSGQPPRLSWQLPPGFSVGEISFPVPKRYAAGAGLVTYNLDGNPTLIQRLTAPAGLTAGEKLKLTASIRWLACETICVPGQASPYVELPVAASGTEPAPANADIFRQARQALPIAPSQAKHVKITPAATVQAVAPGDSFEVELRAVVGQGKHIQSNQPPMPDAIATHAFIELHPALEIGQPTYPPPQEHVVKGLGKVSEYRGKVLIRVPVKVREDATGTAVRVAGVLTSQACDDKQGICFPSEHVAWRLELPLASHKPATTAPVETEPAPKTAATSGEPTPTEPEPAATATTEAADNVPAPGTTGDDGLEKFLASLGLPGLLIGCFIYGLFINATPCVLPVLSIKVLGFVQQAHESRGRTLVLGLAFGGGVVLLFIVLGFLASRGQNVLQYPGAVIGLGAVVMALALSMLGVYTLQVPTTATKLDATLQREGVLTSFGKGALAPVLGFACTGPLLAGVFGWATQQPPQIAFIAFVVTGLGMASPYVLLGANPNWLAFLPKPGQWMITFERVMGFLLLAMVVWLLHPLVTQMGAQGLEWTMGFMVVVALGCWMIGKIDFNMSAARRWSYRGAAAGVVLATGVLVYGVIYPPSKWEGGKTYHSEADWSERIPWQAWSLRETVRAGNTVFVDFTAAYCTQCKKNKAVAIDTPDVRNKMQALGVVPMQGDFTSGDPEIADMLRRFSRSGTPLNVIYPAGRPDQPILLPSNLSESYVLEKLDEAGPSKNAPGVK